MNWSIGRAGLPLHTRPYLLCLLGTTLYCVVFAALFSVFGAATGSFEVVPVVVAALLWGARGGVLAAAFLGLLDGLLLYPLAGIPTQEFLARGAPVGVALTTGTGAVVGRVSDLKRRLRAELAERLRAEADLRAARDGLEARVAERTAELRERDRRFRTFVQEVLLCVTDGTLRLCDDPSDLPEPLPRAAAPVPLERATLQRMRHSVHALASDLGLPAERVADLVLATGEAAMNAVAHGCGGRGWVCAEALRGTVQVWIEDRGRGIDVEWLHRATLEKGFTTAGSLGQGFGILLHTVDRVWLLTGPGGTTLVLEQDRETPSPW